MRPEDVKVPAFLPDTPEVRGDILDYYFAVQRYDRDTGDILRQIEAAGRLDNTLVVMTGDNGMPFPRAKANALRVLTRTSQPLAVRWPGPRKGRGPHGGCVGLPDRPHTTFLEGGGTKAGTGNDWPSFLAAITGDTFHHAGRGLPRAASGTRTCGRGTRVIRSRAIRTDRYLYVRNLRPDLSAGDPQLWFAVGPFGDIDPGPSKDVVTTRQSDPAIAPFLRLACDKHPAEELYDLAKGPERAAQRSRRERIRPSQGQAPQRLDDWMKQTADPRAHRRRRL